VNALVYVLVHDAKNKLIELKRKPAKLVMYLVVIALMAFIVISSIVNPAVIEVYTNILWLKAVAMAFFLFTLFMSIKQGLARGTTLFNMEDVNLLFVSPLSPQSILLYGVVRMMKTTLLSTMFILFNTQTLRNMFGVEFGGVLIVFAAFVLVSAVSQLLTLVIYSATNSKPRRQQFVRRVTALLFAPLVIGAVWFIQAAGMDVSEGLLNLMRSPISSLTPITGWAAAGIIEFLSGSSAMGALYFGLLVISGAVLVAVIYIGNPDYYEDVLVATETAFEKARDIADGNLDAASAMDKKIKVKATGIGGFGASAIFLRHVRESFRINRFGLWGFSTLVLLAAGIGYALLMRYVGYEGGEHLFSMIIILAFLQVFLAGTGRGVKDTYTHYIYMIPESPLKKMIWSNLEVIFKVAVQNTLILVAGGILLGSPLHLIVVGIITCTLFASVVLGMSFVSMRFTGSHMSFGILSMIHFLAIFVVMIPGLVGAIVALVILGQDGMTVALLILSAWELIAAVGCFALAKGVLHNSDMQTISQMTKV